MKNTKLANTLTKALLILLSALMLVTSVVYCFNPKTASAQSEIINGEAAETEILEEEEEYADPFADGKIYCDATLDDDFCDDSLIVVLDEKLSKLAGIANDIVSRFFSLINCKSIENLTEILNPSQSLLDYYKTHKFRQILHIKLGQNSKQYVLKTIKFLEKLDGILYVGPDEVVSLDLPEDDTQIEEIYESEVASVAVNDSKFDDLWGLHGDYGISAPSAWDFTTGSKKIRVGVMDTGIANHEDLNANLAEGLDFNNSNSVTNDDAHGHGTHVAGTIAAVANNNIGIAGVAPNVTLVPLQITNEENTANLDVVMRAISYATSLWGKANQISILNYSFSDFGKNVSLLSLIYHFPGLFVWSAGNEGENVDNYESIKNFKLDNLISVGSSNKSGKRSTWIFRSSNYGENVDVFAPGSSILSTYLNNSYTTKSGTSMAAPHVSGVAALLWSMNPSLSASAIKSAIINGATRIMMDTPDGVKPAYRLTADDAIAYISQNRIPMHVAFSIKDKSDGWNVYIINQSNFEIYVTYNSRMCFNDDAKNFSGLQHLTDIVIPANGSKLVNIKENGTACYIVAAINYSYNGKNYRKITYANGISKDGTTNDVRYNQVSYNAAFPTLENEPKYLTVIPTDRQWKWTYNWDIKITNPNQYAVQVSYNSNMCFNGDAANFTVSDIVTITIPANSSVVVKILGNGTACYITTCINYSYKGYDCRKITYANNLAKNNGNYSLTPYYNDVRVL